MIATNTATMPSLNNNTSNNNNNILHNSTTKTNTPQLPQQLNHIEHFNNSSNNNTNNIEHNSTILNNNNNIELNEINKNLENNLKKELSQSLLSLFSQQLIQNNLKEYINEIIFDKCTSNAFSYQFKKRENLRRRVSKQFSYIQQNKTIINNLNGKVNYISLNHLNNNLQNNLQNNTTTTTVITTPNINPSSLSTTINILNNNIEKNNLENDLINNLENNLFNNNHSIHLPSSFKIKSNKKYSTTSLNNQEEFENTESEDENEKIKTNWHDELIDDELMVNSQSKNNNQNLQNSNNKQLLLEDIDYFRKIMLIEWDEFKTKNFWKYDFIYLRRNQLEKELEIINNRMNELQKEKEINIENYVLLNNLSNNILNNSTVNNDCVNNNNTVNNNSSNSCSRLMGISTSKEWKQINPIFMKQKLSKRFYSPSINKNEMMNHPFFQSIFNDKNDDSLNNGNNIEEKKRKNNSKDLSKFISLGEEPSSNHLNNGSLGSSSNDNNNTTFSFPFAFITKNDITNAFDIFSENYPKEREFLPISKKKRKRKSRSSTANGTSNKNNVLVIEEEATPVRKKIAKNNSSVNSKKGGRGASASSSTSGKATSTRSSTRRRQTNTAGDYDDVVVDYGTPSSSYIPEIKPKEIFTPQWKIQSIEEDQVPYDEDNEEDISDERYCQLHYEKEVKERQRYYLGATSEKKKKNTTEEDMDFDVPTMDEIKEGFKQYIQQQLKSGNSSTQQDETSVSNRLLRSSKRESTRNRDKKSIDNAPPRWKQVTIESYVPLPNLVLDDDEKGDLLNCARDESKRGNWDELRKIYREQFGEEEELPPLLEVQPQGMAEDEDETMHDNEEIISSNRTTSSRKRRGKRGTSDVYSNDMYYDLETIPEVEDELSDNWQEVKDDDEEDEDFELSDEEYAASMKRKTIQRKKRGNGTQGKALASLRTVPVETPIQTITSNNSSSSEKRKPGRPKRNASITTGYAKNVTLEQEIEIEGDSMIIEEPQPQQPIINNKDEETEESEIEEEEKVEIFELPNGYHWICIDWANPRQVKFQAVPNNDTPISEHGKALIKKVVTIDSLETDISKLIPVQQHNDDSSMIIQNNSLPQQQESNSSLLSTITPSGKRFPTNLNLRKTIPILVMV
ncbi:hypothetical protein ABK040_000217 [Willaertia magna]